MLFYRAALPLSRKTLNHVAGIIRRHRKSTGSLWRKLDCGQQALLVLACLRKGETFAELAAGFGVGTTTAWRYVTETVDLLAARAPKLRINRRNGLDIILDPPRGVGSIAVGMPFGQAQREQANIPGYLVPLPGRESQPGYASYDSGMSVAVEPDVGDVVASIEIYRPGPSVRVLYQGIDVFALPANEVIGLLRVLTSVVIEDEGRTVVAPDLLLALWRPTLPEEDWDEDGRFFQSVLLAKPGYYDTGFTEFVQADNSRDEPGNDNGRLW